MCGSRGTGPSTHIIPSGPQPYQSGSYLQRIPPAETLTLLSGLEPAILDPQAPSLIHVATLPSRPSQDACNGQICLPGSHPPGTFQQEFSALIIQYRCPTILPSGRNMVPSKTLTEVGSASFPCLLPFPTPGFLTDSLLSALATCHAVVLPPYENRFSENNQRAVGSIGYTAGNHFKLLSLLKKPYAKGKTLRLNYPSSLQRAWG